MGRWSLRQNLSAPLFPMPPGPHVKETHLSRKLSKYSSITTGIMNASSFLTTLASNTGSTSSSRLSTSSLCGEPMRLGLVASSCFSISLILDDWAGVCSNWMVGLIACAARSLENCGLRKGDEGRSLHPHFEAKGWSRHSYRGKIISPQTEVISRS
jgi:hypothetical protein